MQQSRRTFMQHLTAGTAAGLAAEHSLAQTPEITTGKLPEDEAYWRWIASQFITNPEVAYMNTGSRGPSPIQVIKAQYEAIQAYDADRLSYAKYVETTQTRAELRARLAAFVGCDQNEIALTNNTTEGMAFGTLEDLEFTFELVIFPEPFLQHGELLARAKEGGEGGGPLPLLVTGNLEAGEPPKLLVRDLMPLADAESKLVTALRVRLKEEDLSHDRLVAMRGMLDSHAGDCSVFVHITIPGDSETVLAVGGIRGVDPSDGLRRQIDGLFGRAVAERGW